MYLDIQSAVLPIRSQNTLPALSARAHSTDKIKSYGKLTGLYSHPNLNDQERVSVPTKVAMSFTSGRTSRASSISKQDSISKLYEKVNANLLGKINESVLSSSANLKEKQLEQERQRKNLAITFLRTADTFGHFLEPYTTEFIQTVEHSRAEINFNINDPTEDDLNVFIEQQSNIAAVARKILDECVVGKILAKKGLEELGKVLVSVIDTLIAKYTKVLQACKPQLRAKNLLSEQKEQQAMLVTKNEKTLFESIRLVNFLHNPLFALDERMKHKYIDNLVKNKQFLRESKTSFRIEVVNNFEEDLKKLGKVYVETKNQNDILVKENVRIKALLDEINGRYMEDQKLLRYKNQQLIKKKKEQEENGEINSRSGSPSGHDTPKNSVLLTLQQENDRIDDIPLISKQDIDELYDRALIAGGKDAIRQKYSKAADSQTFVITYLEKELRSLEAELQRCKQDVERLKTEKNIMGRKLQDLEEAEMDKKMASKEAAIQCAFLSEKEGYVEAESTLEKILKGKDPLKMTAVEHEEEWLLLMINMVYQEKFQADMQDDFDGKQRKSLAQFCKEWFLNRFGFQQAAEVMLRDFLKTLTKFVQKHPRYKTFGMLIGLSEAYDIKLPETIGNASKEDTKVAAEYFKRQFIMSHYGISIFNKAVLLAKSSRCAAQFDTFLPDIHNQDDDALEIKGLVAVLRDLLVLLEIPADDMKQILGQFDLMVEGDAYFKMIEKQFEKENAKLNIHEEIEKGLSVRMDYYLLFVLENVAAIFIRDLEQVYMQIRLTNEFVNHANVTVDVYRDAWTNLNIEKSQRWLEVTYENLMQNDIKHAPPLFQTFGQLAPYVIEKASQMSKMKLPEDGYPLFQCCTAAQYNDKDVKERIKRWTDLEGNYKLLKVTYQFVKASLSKYQKRAGNVDYLNDLLEKDMNSIKTAMANLKFTHRQGEKEKVKGSLELNWRRLRMIMKARHFIPKEQQG